MKTKPKMYWGTIWYEKKTTPASQQPQQRRYSKVLYQSPVIDGATYFSYLKPFSEGESKVCGTKENESMINTYNLIFYSNIPILGVQPCFLGARWACSPAFQMCSACSSLFPVYREDRGWNPPTQLHCRFDSSGIWWLKIAVSADLIWIRMDGNLTSRSETLCFELLDLLQYNLLEIGLGLFIWL